MANPSIGSGRTVRVDRSMQPAVGTLEPGAAFGQYRVVRLLGRGGMGEVYEVEHSVLERRYALKVLPSDFAAGRRAVGRFSADTAGP